MNYEFLQKNVKIIEKKNIIEYHYIVKINKFVHSIIMFLSCFISKYVFDMLQAIKKSRLYLNNEKGRNYYVA